jgi:hypothetical protein
MTKDEALKMAINTLCDCGLQIGGSALISPYIHEAVYACKEALQSEASEQEPVAIVYSMQDGYVGQMVVKGISHKTKLYTHPHQWQGLTDDEVQDMAINTNSIREFYIAIEQALKEKNTP